MCFQWFLVCTPGLLCCSDPARASAFTQTYIWINILCIWRRQIFFDIRGPWSIRRQHAVEFSWDAYIWYTQMPFAYEHTHTHRYTCEYVEEVCFGDRLWRNKTTYPGITFARHIKDLYIDVFSHNIFNYHNMNSHQNPGWLGYIRFFFIPIGIIISYYKLVPINQTRIQWNVSWPSVSSWIFQHFRWSKASTTIRFQLGVASPALAEKATLFRESLKAILGKSRFGDYLVA